MSTSTEKESTCFRKAYKFFADWRDESGKRKRKSFITAKAALMYETQQKAAPQNSPAPGPSKAILQARNDTYRDKVPHRDIAAVLGCSVRTIYNLLPTARRRLTDILHRLDLL